MFLKIVDISTTAPVMPALYECSRVLPFVEQGKQYLTLEGQDALILELQAHRIYYFLNDTGRTIDSLRIDAL